jgi:NAD+ synthase
MVATDNRTLEEYKKRVISFIRDYMKSAGLRKGIVGLSGGVDSALTYFLTCEAIGTANTIAVLMPYKTSKKFSVEFADRLIALKNGKRIYFDITGMIEAFLQHAGNTSKTRLGNLMARIRMLILYDVAAEQEGLVVGTGNKTEIMLGYFTVYGDGGCALEPLGDLYKTEVWELARLVGIPKEIIRQTPTADLWKGQTDEAELGIDYPTADSILFCIIEKNYTNKDLIDGGFQQAHIDRVFELVKSSRFKRKIPPRPHLRSYNRDYI